MMRVFFPTVKSSFSTVNPRALFKERGSLPKVHTVADVAQFAAGVNAPGFQNGVVVGLKLDWLVCGPETIFTRAPPPVTLHPPKRTSPAVPWQLPYTSVGSPEWYVRMPETYHPPKIRSLTPPSFRYRFPCPNGSS